MMMNRITTLSIYFLLLAMWSVTEADVELPRGKFHHSVVDLEVKTQGKDIPIVRTWYKDKWFINRRWNDIQIKVFFKNENTRIYSSQKRAAAAVYMPPPPKPRPLEAGVAYDPSIHTLDSINRNEDIYTSSIGFLVHQGKRYFKEIEGGFKWYNPRGDWIIYDSYGRMSHFGRGSVTQGSVIRDGEHRIVGAKDIHGTQIYWFEYNAENQIIRVTDNSTPARSVQYIYEDNKMVRSVDVLGNESLYTYQGKYIHTLTDPNGKTTTVTYKKGSYYPHSILDINGVGWSYFYDYDKVRKEYYITLLHSSGASIENWYNKSSEITKQVINGEDYLETKITSEDGLQVETHTDRRNQVTTEYYNEARQLVKVEYPDNTTVEYTRENEYSNITQSVGKNGLINHYEYSSEGHLTAMIEAVGTADQRRTEFERNVYGDILAYRIMGDAQTETAEYRYQYDNQGNLVQFIDGEGNQTAYQYDNRGNVLTIQQHNPEDVSLTTTYTYNMAGWLIKVTLPSGRYRRFSYDNNGNLIQTQTFTAGDVLSESLQYQYDHRNNLIQTTDSLGHRTRYTYDDRDSVTAVIDAKGNTQSYTYDRFNRISNAIDAMGNKTSWQYGKGGTYTGGLLEKIDYPTYMEERTYDEKTARLIRTITRSKDSEDNAAAQITQYEYDGLGNLVQLIDPKNRTYTLQYDHLKRLIRQVDSEGQTTHLEYDARDNILKVTDANGQAVRRFQYDKNNQALSESKAMGQTQLNTYNALGLLSQQTDAMGQVGRFNYDNEKRLNQMAWYAHQSAPTPTKTTVLSYNTEGLLSSYENNQSSTQIQYDTNHQKISETVNFGPFSKTFQYSYDVNGQKSSYTTPEGVTIQYYYNAEQQLEQVEIPDVGYLTYTYGDGVVEQLSLPGNSNQYWRYDGFLRPVSILSQNVAQTPLDSRDYRYDTMDNIVLQTTREGKFHYDYNPLDRLTQVNFLAHDNLEIDHNLNTTHPPEKEEYTYDPVGNRLSSQNALTWSYNANNELLQILQGGQTTNFSYNANGQLIQKTVNGVQTHFEYTIDGRLATIKDNQQQRNATYAYDPMGRRISKMTYEAGTALQTIYYLYSDEGLVGEYDSEGNLIQSYGYVPNSDYSTKPLYTHRPDFADSNGYAYYINDHLGTPKKLITNNGRVVWFGEAEAFGNTDLVNQEFRNPWRFPGQYFDDESGLHYNYFRYYDPNLGRYIVNDPIGLAGGLNTYLYVEGNSINLYDPYGLEAVLPPQIIPPLVEGAGTAIGAGAAGAVGTAGAIIIGAMWPSSLGEGSDVVPGQQGNENNMFNRPPGFWPGDQGAKEWDRRNNTGRKGRDKFHEIKQRDKGPASGPKDACSVNPETGEVLDGNGEHIGDLDE